MSRSATRADRSGAAGARGRTGGHSHTHDPELLAAVRTPLRTRVVLLVILVPVLVATVVGAVVLWPSHDALPAKQQIAVPGAAFLHGTAEGPATDQGLVRVRVDGIGDVTPDPTAPDDAERVPTSVGRTVEASAAPQLVQHGFSAGDRLVLLYLPASEDVTGATDTGTTATEGDPADGTVYSVVDFDRRVPLGLLALSFGVLVVVVARWRGLAALVGLGAAVGAVVWFTLPALLEGRSATGVAVVTSVAVMVVTLYFAHGFSVRTTTALLGTVVGVVLTALLARWATTGAYITGATSEESYWLPSQAPHVSLSGIALCGMILAGLGALNDVTITQASSVWELRALAPDAPRRTLFSSAMRIGRDHIASSVYTLAFAYLGASLPVLLAAWLQAQSTTLTLTTGSVVEEIVRTLVGAIGLVLAIPLTTLVAALCVPAPVVAATATPVPAADAAAGTVRESGPDGSRAATEKADDAFWGRRGR